MTIYFESLPNFDEGELKQVLFSFLLQKTLLVLVFMFFWFNGTFSVILRKVFWISKTFYFNHFHNRFLQSSI